VDGIDRAACRQAADLIEGAFAWCASPEGHDYWEEVVRNLETRGGRRCDHCRQVIPMDNSEEKDNE